MARPILHHAALAGIVLASVLAMPAHADVFLIVNVSNPVRALTKREATDLFMGRQHNYADGEFALPLDLPRDSAGRANFYRLLTGADLAQVNSYWARLMFGGQTLPPQPMPDEAAMLNVVARNPSAIGYVGQEPADRNVRVVLVLKDAK